jgi:predicted DNA-binding transcriptional regulator YafY
MPITKNVFARYQILDECFRRKHYTIDELLDKVRDTLCTDVSERTLRSDIEYMESQFNVKFDGRKIGHKLTYHYSDPNFRLPFYFMTDEQKENLATALDLVGSFSHLPNMEFLEADIKELKNKIGFDTEQAGIIQIDQNLSTAGLDKLFDVREAVNDKIPMRVVYKPFNGKERRTTVHPYMLRQYKSRWYLIGLEVDDDGNRQLTQKALDRIEDIYPSPEGQETFIERKEGDEMAEYLKKAEHVIGVTVLKGKKVETILLKFNNRFPYILTKPLHQSQKVVDAKKHIVSISVIPNPELFTLLRSYGTDVEVLAPKSVRQKMAVLARRYAKMYLADKEGDE